MKIFLDTSKIEEMKKWSHIIDGVTTNPSILQKEGGNVEEICEYMNPLPVSVEAGGDIYTEAMDLWDWLHPLNKNLAIKVPFLKPNGQDNLLVIDSLIKVGVTINCTAVMSFNQVILAAKLGCRYISLFVGRIDDEGGDAESLVKDCADFVSINSFNKSSEAIQELILGSIRSSKDMGRYSKAIYDSMGYSIITIPPSILEKMTQHRYAQETSKQFEDDYIPVVELKGLRDTQKALGIFHPTGGND